MKKFRSPQEKKLLSYKKDCRNTYGERGSHSRHAITAHKERDRRAFRHQTKQILNQAESTETDILEFVDNEVKSVRASSWRKWSDTPLGEVFISDLELRQIAGINETIKKTLISKD
jgi:hypothetical protein